MSVSTGSVAATIPMPYLSVQATGTYLPPPFSPWKRMSPQRDERKRKRAVVQSSVVRRLPANCQDEFKPPT